MTLTIKVLFERQQKMDKMKLIPTLFPPWQERQENSCSVKFIEKLQSQTGKIDMQARLGLVKYYLM